MFCPPGFADVDETGTINLVDAAKEVRGQASLYVEGGVCKNGRGGLMQEGGCSCCKRTGPEGGGGAAAARGPGQKEGGSCCKRTGPEARKEGCC